MQPNRQIPGSPEEWLLRAKGDLALARVPLPKGCFYEDLCFHAQQAAEKALKSVYPEHGRRDHRGHALNPMLAESASAGGLIEA